MPLPPFLMGHLELLAPDFFDPSQEARRGRSVMLWAGLLQLFAALVWQRNYFVSQSREDAPIGATLGVRPVLQYGVR